MFRGASAIVVFFFNDTATTEIYTLSLHDALPISTLRSLSVVLAIATVWALYVLVERLAGERTARVAAVIAAADRKSTRLNSSHLVISYAVFCLKKKRTSSAPTRSRRSSSPRALRP